MNKHFNLRIFSFGFIILVLLFLPAILATYWIYVLNLIFIYIILALGFNVLVGFAGQFAICHVGFFGIGVYTYGLLNTNIPIPFLFSVLAGGIVAAVVGFLIAIPSIRMRDIYLAMVTFSFAEVLRWIFLNWDSVTGGPNGLRISPATISKMQLTTDQQVYYVIFPCMFLLVVLTANMAKSRLGRAFFSIKDSEAAAMACGINVYKYKILAFGLSAFYAGVAGGLYGVLAGFIHPESLGFLQTILYLSMVVIGGLGTIPGPVIGACLLGIVPEFLREFSFLQEMLYGVVLMIFIVLMPLGIYGSMKARYEKMMRDKMQDVETL
jgi:branched-chain amino acid transport system permease protein